MLGKISSRAFFFAPSLIESGGSEGEGVGDGEWDMDGEGIGTELCRGALCPEALKQVALECHLIVAPSVLFFPFPPVASPPHYHLEWWIPSLFLSFRISSAPSPQLLFPNL